MVFRMVYKSGQIYCGIYIWTDLSIVLSQLTRVQTDRQTDGRTDGQNSHR